MPTEFDLLWSEGRVIDAGQFHLDPFDEGLLYGRGLFETTRTEEGWPWLWEGHLSRLQHASVILEIPINEARLPSAADVHDFAQRLGQGEIVVRLNASAGSAGRPGQVWMTARPITLWNRPARLEVAPERVDRLDGFATWKTFHYGLRRQAFHRARARGFDDALLISTDGLVLETATANIVLKIGNEWLTPSLEGGVLAGTVRHALLSQMPSGRSIRETPIPFSQLDIVQAAFATNSAQGIVPVGELAGRPLSVAAEMSFFLERLSLFIGAERTRRQTVNP